MNPIWYNALLSSNAAAAETYSDVLVNTYGASEVWPLVNASGTTISAFINSARNGTLQGWDLQNAAGPVTGTLAPFSDGTNDYGNIYSSGGGVGMADIFNGNVGSLFIWLKVTNSGVWTDGAARVIFHLRNNVGNRVLVSKWSSNNELLFVRAGGGTNRQTMVSASPTAWFSLGMSWSTTADEQIYYINGSQVGSTVTGLGTFVGSLGSTTTMLSALNAGPTDVWSGWLAYAAVKFGSVWSAANFAAMHAAAT